MSSRIEDNLCEQLWMGDPVDLQGGSRTRDSPTRIDINSIMFCYVVYVQKKNGATNRGQSRYVVSCFSVLMIMKVYFLVVMFFRSQN